MNENNLLCKIKKLEVSILRCLNVKNSIKSTPTQMQILSYMIENENKAIYQKELENVLNLRRATVSGVLKTMEKNKLIKRVVDDKDTRTKQIIMDNKIKESFTEIKSKFEQIEIELTKNISKEEITMFLNILSKLEENVENINSKGE